ncbi:MAG: superoxide dismutase, Ni [Acidobacteria bacterium]|nr:MAG: superoxide dismutase, Ni [Acidobacteriota bacterium]
MIYELIEKLDRRFPFERAKAHCDIPCGIYDPHHAQLAALTVIRMIDLMNELVKEHGQQDMEFHNSMARYIAVKEQHAELCKHEVRIIWGDYIKPEHVQKYPELHELTNNIMKLGSKCRQTTSRETAVELLQAVNRFAEIFWETKGIATKRAKAPYKPEEEVVYPVLS